MQKHLISTVSAIALLLGTASLANAQDRNAPTAQDPAVTSPSSGAIKMDDAKKDDPATQPRSGDTRAMDKSRDADRSRAADRTGYKSYSEDKSSGAIIAGGYSAEQLIGINIHNASGNSIGEIEDLLVGSDNKVDKAIVEVGGFLGMGSKNVAVDINELRHDSQNKNFVSSMTKEQLKTLPEYEKKSGTWVPKAM